MNYIVFGANVQASPVVSATSTIAVPANAEAAYISTDQTLRVSVDGITTPTTNIGLFCPANTTTLLAVKAQTNLVLFNVSGSTANVSVQFLGT